MSTTTPISLPRVLATAFRRAVQWRLWLLWVLVILGCALLAAVPAGLWFGSSFGYSVHAPAIAAGDAPLLVMQALMSKASPLLPLSQVALAGALITLLLSPLLAAAALACTRASAALGFGDLVRAGIAGYGPMLRLMLLSVLPVGLAIALGTLLVGAIDGDASEKIEAGRSTLAVVASVAAVLLVVLAHASVEASRGWLGADGRLRSAWRAWMRGLRLLRRRPLAVLAVWLLTTLAGLAVALAVLLVRQRVHAVGVGSALAAFVFPAMAVAALAWGRIARLAGMQALAMDAHATR